MCRPRERPKAINSRSSSKRNSGQNISVEQTKETETRKGKRQKGFDGLNSTLVLLTIFRPTSLAPVDMIANFIYI